MNLILEAARDLFEVAKWLPVALLVLCSFILGVFLESLSLFAPWSLSALLFSFGMWPLQAERAHAWRRTLLAGLGFGGCCSAFLIVNLATLIVYVPEPLPTLFSSVPALYLLGVALLLTAVWIGLFLVESFEQKELIAKAAAVRAHPLNYAKAFGVAITPLFLSALLLLWSRGVSIWTFGARSLFFEVGAVWPFLGCMTFSALFFSQYAALIRK